jgi:DNA-binding CsgD family transcriptional regulator
MVRLLGEVAGVRGGHQEKKRYLMDGLCRLIGADAWAWSLLHLQADLAPRQLVMLNGGFDEDRLAKWATAIEHPQMKPVTGSLVAEAAAGTRGFTRKDRDFVPQDWWDSDDRAFQLWTEAGIRSFLLSAWPLPEGRFSGIGIYRNKDRPHFDARECRIAHILLSEIPWLHQEGMNEDEGQALVPLQPRHRTVLNLLVQGWGRKKISEHLGLTLNTTHGYVKQIFQHFDVHTQPELISRLTQGNGGDR